MRNNLPVTPHEFDYSGQELLMSTTDARGMITHCNAAFSRVSGYTISELMGQPHNMVRHPDMPLKPLRICGKPLAMAVLGWGQSKTGAKMAVFTGYVPTSHH